MLPEKRDVSFMDAVLHRLYSGEGNMTVLDMSESNFTDNQVKDPALHPPTCLHAGGAK